MYVFLLAHVTSTFKGCISISPIEPKWLHIRNQTLGHQKSNSFPFSLFLCHLGPSRVIPQCLQIQCYCFLIFLANTLEMPLIIPGRIWHSKSPIHISAAGDRVKTCQTNGLRGEQDGSQKGKRSVIRRGMWAVETNKSFQVFVSRML